MTDITRRDFLNGVALTIAAGLTPAAQLAAQPLRYPPALTGMRGHHVGSFEVGHDLRDGKKFSLDASGDRRALRSGRGRRRHQRTGGGLVLPARQSRGANPDPGQPRRLRRPRQAQRVPPRWPPDPGLRRQRVAAIAQGALQRRGQGSAQGSRRRHRALRYRLRAPALSVAQAVARRVLCTRDVRARRARHRRPDDHAGRRPRPGPAQRQAVARIRRTIPDLGRRARRN